MSVLISQSVINYVEEENIPALKALLEKCKDVDERNEVRLRLNSSRVCRLLSAHGAVLWVKVGETGGFPCCSGRTHDVISCGKYSTLCFESSFIYFLFFIFWFYETGSLCNTLKFTL